MAETIPTYCKQEILVAVYHQQDLIQPPLTAPLPPSWWAASAVHYGGGCFSFLRSADCRWVVKTTSGRIHFKAGPCVVNDIHSMPWFGNLFTCYTFWPIILTNLSAAELSWEPQVRALHLRGMLWWNKIVQYINIFERFLLSSLTTCVLHTIPLHTPNS